MFLLGKVAELVMNFDPGNSVFFSVFWNYIRFNVTC